MLDSFITSAMVIFDNINSDKMLARKTVINNTIIDKQYLAYYLYRIWIKHRKLMEKATSNADFDEILSFLEIPAKYQAMNLVYPMANKMTINEKQLDLVILSILKQFNRANILYSGDANPPADFKQLTTYTEGKSVENIIQDIIQLKLLLPNLSRPANVFNIWDDMDELIDRMNVIDVADLNTTNSLLNNTNSSNQPTISSTVSTAIGSNNAKSKPDNVINSVRNNTKPDTGSTATGLNNANAKPANVINSVRNNAKPDTVSTATGLNNAKPNTVSTATSNLQQQPEPIDTELEEEEEDDLD
jgi:hypothetical protein